MIKQKYLQLDPDHFILLTLDLSTSDHGLELRSVEWENIHSANEKDVDDLVADFLEELNLDDYQGKKR